MAEQSTSFKELTAFLNELFQFESADLDFGIYRILHYKRAEIGRFVNDTLPRKVQEQLQTLTAADAQNLAAQIADLEKKDTIKGWISAPPEARPTLEQYGNGTIAEYKRLKQLEANMRATEVSENDIYNHLRLFFARYYDKGDFVSKRRFGKNEKYVVPYNGEETFFHWANRDQYYIKSSENFKGYSFRFATPSGSMAVHFKLTVAEVPQGNVKADEARYFILSTKHDPELTDTDTTFYFQYRALTTEEKEEVKGNSKQDTLNQAAYDTLKAAHGTNVLLQPLWQPAPGNKEGDATALLLKKLSHYTKKNSYDFFIHKDLKGFLDRELDFYIKTELVRVDDLYTTDTDAHYERLRLSLRKIKAFKAIAETIIQLLAQIEDFQKKLWEKKKFVIGTEWVITMDRLVQYVGEDTARPLLEQVVKNAEQVAEWRSLYGEDIVSKGKLTVDGLKTKDGNYHKLPFDTKHFDTSVKEQLLNVLSEKVNLEDRADGLVLNSDNYHGLQLLSVKYNDQIKAVYIDPPYNTGEDGFVYRDSFKSSSWTSMFSDRLAPAKSLLKSDGLFLCHMDEHEHIALDKLIGDEFGVGDMGRIIWDKRNPKGDSKGIGVQHEYVQVAIKDPAELANDQSFIKNKENAQTILYKASYLIKRNKGVVNDDLRKQFKDWMKCQDFTGGELAYNLIDANGDVYQSVSMAWPNKKKAPDEYFIPLKHPETGEDCEVPERGWRNPPDTMKKLLDADLIVFGKDASTQPRRKYLLKDNLTENMPSLYYMGGSDDSLFKAMNFAFDNPKPIKVARYFLHVIARPKDSIIIDYFGGSGTTFHATSILNNEDEGKRKCILIEQGGYVDVTIIPRIKKVAYSFDWQDCLPKSGSMNGLGVFFKYQRLEQYEEALENIAFSAPEGALQQAMEFDDYIPKYFLDFETRSSRTLVNLQAMEDPFDYRLKVWDGYTYDNEQPVDLIETFLYLHGLHLCKQMTKERDGRRYVFVLGRTNADKKVLSIWRSIKGWELPDLEADGKWLAEELNAWEYDELVVNGKALLPEGLRYDLTVEEVFTAKMFA